MPSVTPTLRIALTGLPPELGASMAQLLSGARGVVVTEGGVEVRFVPVQSPQAVADSFKSFDGVLVVCGGAALLTMLPRLRHKPLAWVEYCVERQSSPPSHDDVQASMSQQGVFVVREARGEDIRWLTSAGHAVARFFAREARVAAALEASHIQERDPVREPLLPPQQPKYRQSSAFSACGSCVIL